MQPPCPEPKSKLRRIASLHGLVEWRGVVRTVVGIGISILFIVLLMRRIDVGGVVAIIDHMTPLPVIAALVCLAVGYCVRISRAHFMLRSIGVPASFRAVACAFMSGSALNNILPMRAGDIVRTVAFTRDLGASPSVIAGTLVIERVFDMIVLLGIFFLVLPSIPEGKLSPAIIDSARVISFVAAGVAACVVFLPRVMCKIMHRLFGSSDRHPILGFADRLLRTLATLCHPRILATLMLFSIGGWLLEGAYYAALASAFQFALPLVGAYAALALGALSTLIPSSPGYIGTFHYFVSQAMIAFGLSTDDGVAYAVVVHGIAWFAITCVGITLLVMRGPRKPAETANTSQPTPPSNLSGEIMEPVSVIINVFNEAETIEGEIRAIHNLILQRLPGSELIVAEDGSRDGTSDIIRRLVTELGIVHSTSVERKGYSKAFRDAVEIAKNEWVFFSDTGGKNDFADFWKLYEAREGADLVIGLRGGRTDQFYRQAMTWGYNSLLRFYFGIHVKDADSGFRLYRTSYLKQIVQQPWINKELISSEIVVRMHHMGAVIREVPIIYQQRKGVSRGLPPGKIPKVIFRVMRNMPKLKQAAADLRKRSV